jgi:alkylation response protein AidB-like acyl-CoA dehydrogenase
MPAEEMETRVLVTAQGGVSEYLAAIEQLAPLVRQQRHAFDEQRRIPDQVFGVLAKAGLFRLYLPKTLGGPELSPFDFMTVSRPPPHLTARLAGWSGMAAG